MVHTALAVFVNQCESRAGNLLRRGCVQAADNAFRQRGFSRAKIPDQQHHGAPRKIAADAASEFDGLVFGMGNFSHLEQTLLGHPAAAPRLLSFAASVVRLRPSIPAAAVLFPFVLRSASSITCLSMLPMVRSKSSPLSGTGIARPGCQTRFSMGSGKS